MPQADVSQAFVLPDWLNADLLASMRRGIEKEGLRMRPDGFIAQSPHPTRLGSKLTHPHITTDYAESLLELITEPLASVQQTLAQLRELHIVVQQALENDELFWGMSMPCMLADSDDDILLADYGSSNSGRLKTLYRHGLGLRYGRRMQTIAGLHYNLSFGDDFFGTWQAAEGHHDALSAFKNAKYLALVRNFKRLLPLVLYLTGASPAVCACFLTGRQHHLQPLNDKGYYLPNATSLRMGKLGYQNNVQDDLDIRYNRLDEYVAGLQQAVGTPHKGFTALGIDTSDGTPTQINDHILQIENEYYSAIRPKQTTQGDETPSEALAARGVGYIELRALDLDPYSEIGISMDTACFMEILALYCLLSDSPELLPDEDARLSINQERAVNEGRDSHVTILTPTGKVRLQDWLDGHLQAMSPVATLLDETYGSNTYRHALTVMLGRCHHAELTPSAQVLHDTVQAGGTWQFGKKLAEQHAHSLRAQSLGARAAYYATLAEQSISDQQTLEANDTLSFTDYIARFR